MIRRARRVAKGGTPSLPSSPLGGEDSGEGTDGGASEIRCEPGQRGRCPSQISGLIFFLGVSLALGQGHGGKTTTLRGEVIDVTCYLMHPSTGKGAGHKECALKCITKNGLPVGILEEKTENVYLVVDASHRAADLSQYVAQIVTLEGSIHRGKGVNLFVMKGIKK